MMMLVSDKCPFPCSNKNYMGYCQTTACINPKHNGSGTYIYPASYIDDIKMREDSDYGRGNNA